MRGKLGRWPYGLLSSPVAVTFAIKLAGGALVLGECRVGSRNVRPWAARCTAMLTVVAVCLGVVPAYSLR